MAWFVEVHVLYRPYLEEHSAQFEPRHSVSSFISGMEQGFSAWQNVVKGTTSVGNRGMTQEGNILVQ
jgi:hypothetical protein